MAAKAAGVMAASQASKSGRAEALRVSAAARAWVSSAWRGLQRSRSWSAGTKRVGGVSLMFLSIASCVELLKKAAIA